MKRLNPTIRRFLFVSWMALPFLTLLGQTGNFDSGSTEADGAISISTDTVMTLPADGIINATTLTVDSGMTLSFTRNDLNTPVYILATGDVIVNGVIQVDGSPGSQVVAGLGGPGGFDGGAPGSNGSDPGDGRGPGGGLSGTNASSSAGAGSGSYGHVGSNSSSTQKGAIYGSPLLIPMIGGSGGGGTTGAPGYGGGGGGGAILIASNTEIMS